MYLKMQTVISERRASLQRRVCVLIHISRRLILDKRNRRAKLIKIVIIVKSREMMTDFEFGKCGKTIN